MARVFDVGKMQRGASRSNPFVPPLQRLAGVLTYAAFLDTRCAILLLRGWRWQHIRALPELVGWKEIRMFERDTDLSLKYSRRSRAAGF